MKANGMTRRISYDEEDHVTAVAIYASELQPSFDSLETDVRVETRGDGGAEALAGFFGIGLGAASDLDGKVVLGMTGHDQSADGRQTHTRRLRTRKENAREFFGVRLQE